MLPFDINLAVKLCDFSAIAYASDNDIRSFCSERGYTQCEIITDPETDTLVFVASNGKDIVVCTRGTRQDIRDWMTDMDIAFELWKGIPGGFHVHAGFTEAYESVATRIYAAIGSFIATISRPTIFFTGHSLGAAIALLLWMGMNNAHKYGNPILYNFGQPRVGDLTFAKYINSISNGRVIRFVHNLDPVPKLPFRAGKYRHNDDEAWFDNENNVHINPMWVTKLPSDKDAFVSEFEMLGLGLWHRMEEVVLGNNPKLNGQLYIPLIGDHAIVHYRNCLSDWRRNTGSPA